MPLTKFKFNEDLQGYSLSERVDELRKKYNLKKKDLEAYREGVRATMHENQRLIELMRIQNKVRHVLLKQEDINDTHLIKAVLKNDHEDLWAQQRFTAAKCMEEFEDKVGLRENELNAERYKITQDLEILEHFKEESAMLYDIETRPPEMHNEIRLTQLENDLDKAIIKRDAAARLSDQYMGIIEHMKKEAMNFERRLDVMEETLREQYKDRKELQRMCAGALCSRDAVKEMLTKIEHEAHESGRIRNAELNALRKDVNYRLRYGDMERAAEMKERKERAAQALADAEVRAKIQEEEKMERQKKILIYDHAMQKIKAATHEADVDYVVNRVTNQSKIERKLRQQLVDLNEMVIMLKEDIVQLRVDYHDWKYSGDMKISTNRQHLDKTEEYGEKEQKRLNKALIHLDYNGNILAEVKVGIKTLLEKLHHIKLNPPERSYCSTGNVFDEVALCKSKLEVLLKQVETMGDMISMPDSSSTPEHDPDLQKFLEAELRPDNVRIRVKASTSSMMVQFDFEDDGPDNDSLLTRAEIKARCEKLLASKLPKIPKKKKKKKK